MWVWFLCILGFLKHPKVIDIELNQKLWACTSNFQPSLQLMKKWNYLPQTQFFGLLSHRYMFRTRNPIDMLMRVPENISEFSRCSTNSFSMVHTNSHIHTRTVALYHPKKAWQVHIHTKWHRSHTTRIKLLFTLATCFEFVRKNVCMSICVCDALSVLKTVAACQFQNSAEAAAANKVAM